MKRRRRQPPLTVAGLPEWARLALPSSCNQTGPCSEVLIVWHLNPASGESEKLCDDACSASSGRRRADRGVSEAETYRPREEQRRDGRQPRPGRPQPSRGRCSLSPGSRTPAGPYGGGGHDDAQGDEFTRTRCPGPVLGHDIVHGSWGCDSHPGLGSGPSVSADWAHRNAYSRGARQRGKVLPRVRRRALAWENGSCFWYCVARAASCADSGPA